MLRVSLVVETDFEQVLAGRNKTDEGTFSFDGVLIDRSYGVRVRNANLQPCD